MRIVGKRAIAACMFGVVMIAAACTPPSTTGGASSTAWSVSPAVTDPAINADTLNPHRAFAPTGTPLGRLAVVLHGTGSSPNNHNEIAAVLRATGYHVIVLRWLTPLSTTGACPDSGAGTAPDCHRIYRHETVFGGGVPDPMGVTRDHPVAVVSGANSVVNRLLKVVDHLDTVAPTAGWGQFQAGGGGTCTSVDPTYGTCDLVWSQISLLGHSQGAGAALYLAKFHSVHAVGLLSGSFDAYNTGVATAAPWVTEGGFATPTTRIRALTHSADYGLPLMNAVHDSLGLGVAVGPSAPFASRRLLTSVTPTCPLDSAPGHNSTAMDFCTPDGLYDDAWEFLAGS